MRRRVDDRRDSDVGVIEDNHLRTKHDTSDVRNYEEE